MVLKHEIGMYDMLLRTIWPATILFIDFSFILSAKRLQLPAFGNPAREGERWKDEGRERDEERLLKGHRPYPSLIRLQQGVDTCVKSAYLCVCVSSGTRDREEGGVKSELATEAVFLFYLSLLMTSLHGCESDTPLQT